MRGAGWLGGVGIYCAGGIDGPKSYYILRLYPHTVRAVVHLYEDLQAMARRPGFQGIKEEVCVVVDRTEGKPANFDVEVCGGGGGGGMDVGG